MSVHHVERVSRDQEHRGQREVPRCDGKGSGNTRHQRGQREFVRRETASLGQTKERTEQPVVEADEKWTEQTPAGALAFWGRQGLDPQEPKTDVGREGNQRGGRERNEKDQVRGRAAEFR